MSRTRFRSGFTLIEILVAVALLAVLSAALVPLVLTQVQKGRLGRTQQEARAVALAFTQYHADTGHWPCRWRGTPSIDEPLLGYACLYGNTESLPHWKGPYLKKGSQPEEGRVVARRRPDGSLDGIADAWGNPFEVIFRSPDPTRAGEASGVILLLSAGPDLRIGTSADDAVAERPTFDDTIHIVTRKVE